SSVGSARTPVSPNCARVGPRPRTTTGFESVPVTMNPPMVTPAPVLTDARVEMFVSWAVGGSKASPPINLSASCGAKTVDDPLGATFLIDIPANSPTKRFQSRSKASDRGALKAGLYVPKAPSGDPLEENFCTVLVPRSASYKLSA